MRKLFALSRGRRMFWRSLQTAPPPYRLVAFRYFWYRLRILIMRQESTLRCENSLFCCGGRIFSRSLQTSPHTSSQLSCCHSLLLVSTSAFRYGKNLSIALRMWNKENILEKSLNLSTSQLFCCLSLLLVSIHGFRYGKNKHRRSFAFLL